MRCIDPQGAPLHTAPPLPLREPRPFRVRLMRMGRDKSGPYTLNPPATVYIPSLRCPPLGARAIGNTGKAFPPEKQVVI